MYLGFHDLLEQRVDSSGQTRLSVRPLSPTPTRPVVEAEIRGLDDLSRVVVADRLLREHGRPVDWFLPRFPFATGRGGEVEDGPARRSLALELAEGLDPVVADPSADIAPFVRHLPRPAVLATLRKQGLLVPDALVVDQHPPTTHESGLTPLDGRPCVVLARECNTGATALRAAGRLRARHAGPLTLVATHGRFDRGLERLTAAFDHIVTFDLLPSAAANPRPGRDRPTVRVNRPRKVIGVEYRRLHHDGHDLLNLAIRPASSSGRAGLVLGRWRPDRADEGETVDQHPNPVLQT